MNLEHKKISEEKNERTLTIKDYLLSLRILILFEMIHVVVCKSAFCA